jgi:CrcB protein
VPHPNRHNLAAVFLGGVVGTLLRVWLGQRFEVAPAAWPWAIFAINVSGSFVLASLATHLQGDPPRPAYLRPLLGVGFCGAYTTFSTMQIEILHMLDHRSYGLAAGYAVASVAAGYLAVMLGTALVKRAQVRT